MWYTGKSCPYELVWALLLLAYDQLQCPPVVKYYCCLLSVRPKSGGFPSISSDAIRLQQAPVPEPQCCFSLSIPAPLSVVDTCCLLLRQDPKCWKVSLDLLFCLHT